MGSGESRQTERLFPKFRSPSNQDDCVIGKETTKEGIIQKQHTVQENIPKPTTYIMNPIIWMASNQFVRELREEMKTRGIVLNVIQDCDDSKLDTDAFLILVCIHISRLIPDVRSCLSFISSKQYGKTILVIVHMTRHIIFELESERILMECPEHFASIFQIIDMAFTREKGIYPCEFNRNAFRQLEKICDSHNKTVSTKTKSKENEASNDNTENHSNQQLDESHTEHTGAQVHVTAEESMTERDETYTAKPNTFAYKNNQDSLDIPNPTAYILNPRDRVSRKFVHGFREEMKTHGIVLNVIPDCDGRKLNTDLFLILVCIHHTRLQADVDNCLRFISSKQYGKTILVILHVDKYALGSERYLVSLEKYASIFQIIDMAFTTDEGIYPCEMNTNAIRQLEKIYDSHKKTIKTERKSKGDDPRRDNSESHSIKQLDESHTEVIPEKKIETDEKEDLPKIVESETQLLIDFINFHEFKGIFL